MLSSTSSLSDFRGSPDFWFCSLLIVFWTLESEYAQLPNLGALQQQSLSNSWESPRSLGESSSWSSITIDSRTKTRLMLIDCKQWLRSLKSFDVLERLLWFAWIASKKHFESTLNSGLSRIVLACSSVSTLCQVPAKLSANCLSKRFQKMHTKTMTFIELIDRTC